jgi:penicillin-binding protein 1A
MAAMVWGRQDSKRREPVLGTHGSLYGLRLSPGDRAGGAVEAERPQREAPPRPPAPKPRKPKKNREQARGKRGGKSGGKFRGNIRTLIYWCFVAGVWAAIALAALIGWHMMRLPPISSLVVPKRPPTITILGIDGKTLAVRGDMGGAAVPLKALPPYLPKAFVAIEDRRFYQHFGLDPIGLARAVVTNVLHRGVREGGSTLTQQLAKNLFLTQERTLSRKIDEVILALGLEAKYSKDQILELYLNRVYFGAGAYGVEAASQRYFGKSARNVTLAEAAMLAGLVKAPSRLAPTRNPKLARERAELVLAAMADGGFISQAMAKSAHIQRVAISKETGPGSIGYAADWVMDSLNDYVGRFDTDVTVQTTIDPVLQSAAAKALADELAHKGDRYGVTQGALVAIDTTGAVRALVGGRNYSDSQFNRAVSAHRQPGSSFKPFVYLTALERGLTPDSVRDDAPIQLKNWKPTNYTHQYMGPVTLTQALANSLNTVAVRLTLEVGPANVVKTARRLGIASPLEANPSIALGTSEVTPLELVGAYVPFANGGIAALPHVIERVRGEKNKVLYARKVSGAGRVVALPYVAMMNRMMQETLLSGTARRASIPGWPAAGKTGTSQDYRDAWFVGYTGHMVAGIWLGNDDSSPTKKATGGGLPVEIWNRFMRVAHQNVPEVDLPGTNLYAGAGWAQSPTPNPTPMAPQMQQYPQQGYPSQTYSQQGYPPQSGGGLLPPGNIGGGYPPQRVPPRQDDNPFSQLFGALFGRR